METQIQERDLQKYVLASEILKAISYPYRLKVLELLEDEEFHAVSEIQEFTQIEPSLLSHHLTKMKDKGIISSHRDGRNIYYKLALKEVVKILDCIDNCLM